MAGRGFLLNYIKKKDDESSNASSTSLSVTSSTPFIITGRGSGRGLTLPNLFPQSHLNYAASTSSAGTGRSITAGRGMFAVRVVPTSIMTQSSVASESSSKLVDSGADTILKDNSVQSKLIVGRGIATSGRGTVSGPGSSSFLQAVPVSQSSVESPRALIAEKALQEGTLKDQNQIAKKYGTKGKEFSAMVNSIELHCDPNSGVYEYEIRFSPAVDNMNFRPKYLMQHRELIGNAKTFDGTILFLPHRLPDEITRLVSKSVVDESDIHLQIIFKRKKRLGECIQLYNVLFEKVFRILNYLRVGRKSFDPTAPKLVPQHKLEIWPGYVKSVDVMEKGLLLSLDVSHRVLSTRTVLDVIIEAHQSDRDRFKENVMKALIGSIVLTRYNNKTYRIDDIVFEKSPRDTFKQRDVEVSYIDYYKKQYNIDIKDPKQFLLISHKEVQISGQAQKSEYVFALVPELCYLTGLSDEMRKNYTVMKDLATYTKLTPFQRVGAFKKFVENVNNTPLAKEVLLDWGLSLEPEPMKLKARLLNEEHITFGCAREFASGPQADFSRYATSNQVLEPIDLQNWILMFVNKDKKQADAFESTILKVAGPTGIRVAQPRRIELQNDGTNTYIQALRKEVVDPKVQIVVIIFPSLRDDRYAAVKRLLCAEIPVPSQCINSKTLRNETKNRSIVQKIILQMNCKMGGTLWGVKIPLSKTMICGIDTFHEAGDNGITVAGFVSSLNPEFTRWFSKPTIQNKREELVNGLTASMESSLAAFKAFNSFLPERIIIYRDGVGNGQLVFVKNYEIPQFKAAFKRFDAKYDPKMTFVVVQKRINTKFFIVNDKSGKDAITNPPPGSVIDHTVTSRSLYDFFLISQHVREGTTTPSHYIVVDDENEFKPDILQQLTYKLCFLYYNWPGTVRVPAPCQYAHKLADLVGMNVKRPVSEKLTDKLFFL